MALAACPGIWSISTIFTCHLGITSYSTNPSLTCSSGGDADSMCWLATTIAFGTSVLHSAFSYIESLFVVIFAVRHCTCADTMAGALYGHSHTLHDQYPVKACLVLSGIKGQARAFHQSNNSICSEEIHGLYNRSFFWWINKLFILGFKTNLSMESLPHLDQALSSNTVHHAVRNLWDKSKGLTQTNRISQSPHPLMFAYRP